MAFWSLIRSSRDTVFFLSAFAMVLYVTLAPHRPAALEAQLVSARTTIVVGDAIGDLGPRAAKDRLASVEPLETLE